MDWAGFIAGIVIVGGFLVLLVILFARRMKNNASSCLTVNAFVIAKRTAPVGGTTFCYVTFQMESGDRMEFFVLPQEYGLLVEGDKGKLTYQGTRYLGFERS